MRTKKMERVKKFLDFYVSYLVENQNFPTVAECARVQGVATHTVRIWVNIMEERGMVKKLNLGMNGLILLVDGVKFVDERGTHDES